MSDKKPYDTDKGLLFNENESEIVASAREMTGFIPAEPYDELVSSNYENMMPMHRQKPAETGDAATYD